MTLLRVRAAEVREGDRIGAGRFQGIVVVATRKNRDGTVRLLLGSHGWCASTADAAMVVER